MAFTALLDASVLFPNYLRDILLRLAEAELYRPLWSDAILSEVRRSVLARRAVDPARLDRTLRLATDCFDDACVQGWEPLVEGLHLPDPDDRHVLAAAVAGGAQSIVTANLKHFPPEALGPLHLEAVDPDHFLLDQLDLAPQVTIATLKAQAHDYRKPPLDLGSLLDRLARAGAPEFADEVRRQTADPSQRQGRRGEWARSLGRTKDPTGRKGNRNYVREHQDQGRRL